MYKACEKSGHLSAVAAQSQVIDERKEPTKEPAKEVAFSAIQEEEESKSLAIAAAALKKK